jgi:AcrR family transcriptional regulator
MRFSSCGGRTPRPYDERYSNPLFGSRVGDQPIVQTQPGSVQCRMGYRHSADEILEAAVALTIDDGIGALTYAAVGARLGISDRTVVYYFPTKAELTAAVAISLGGNLQQLLEDAFGTERRAADELLRRAWPVLTTPAADRVFALYFEMVGLAAGGHTQYTALSQAMLEGWHQWLNERIVGATESVRSRRALAAMAKLDGLLLVRHVLGHEAADGAARELGIA